ncbi:MAG: ABC transporter ATP-binding protein [Ignavibacteriales bacterium]
MDNMVLETKELTKKYGSHTAVNNVDLHVKKGQIYGLLGRNGAGKTTTLRMVMGLLTPTHGDIKIFGAPLKASNASIYRRIGSLIEPPSFYENLTGQENLELVALLRGIHQADTVANALDKMELTDAARKKVSKYSLGMKQRLGIGMAIMHDPEFLILDEPTNGLDPIGIQQMRLFIRSLCMEKGVTVLISSHILNEVEQVADMVGIIHEGNLLTETAMSEIHCYNRQYIKLRVSSVPQAIPLLEQKLSINDFEVIDEHTIRIYEIEKDMASVNKLLNDNDIGVSEITVMKGSLEDYFIKLTGGVTIG